MKHYLKYYGIFTLINLVFTAIASRYVATVLRFLLIVAMLFLLFIVRVQAQDTLKKSTQADSISLAGFPLTGLTSTDLTLSTTFPPCYMVDWGRVKTFKDLKNVISAMDIRFCYYTTDQRFKKVKKYLIIKK